MAQTQQESPQREPGRPCAPAVPLTSCNSTATQGPLPPLESWQFSSLQRGRCHPWLGMEWGSCCSSSPLPPQRELCSLPQGTPELYVTSWDKNLRAFLNITVPPPVGVQQEQHKKSFLKPLQANITQVEWQALHTPALFLFHWYRIFSQSAEL